MTATTRYLIDLGDETITTHDPAKAARYSHSGYHVTAETAAEHTDAVATIEVETNGHVRRVRFVDRADGRVDRYEATKTKSGKWRPVGHEVVDDVRISFE